MNILILEQDVKFAEILRSGLILEGYSAEIANDGNLEEVRILLGRAKYDIIILDCILLENSLDTWRNFRRLSSEIPILLLTEKNSNEDNARVIRQGADDCAEKPFSISEIIMHIRRLLPTQHEQVQDALQVRDLTLHSCTREVRRSGVRIKLTLKEFELLRYLMKRVNQVVGRDEIFYHLWRFPNSLKSNVIDAHIKNLRKKINSRHSQKLLETIHGVGYALRDSYVHTTEHPVSGKLD